MIITDTGMIIRLSVEKISTMSRVTQGVRLINLKEEQSVSSTAIIEKNEESEESETNDIVSVDKQNSNEFNNTEDQSIEEE